MFLPQCDQQKTVASHCDCDFDFFDASGDGLFSDMLVGDLELSLGELFSCFPLEDSFPLM